MFRENTMKCKVQGFILYLLQQDERLKSKERIVKVEMHPWWAPAFHLRDPSLGWGQRRHEALPPAPTLRGPGFCSTSCQPRRWAAAAGKTLKWEVRGCD